MNDIQAASTLRVIGLILLWSFAILGGISLWASFSTPVNWLGLAIGIGLVLTGAFLWAVSTALSSMTVSLMVMRDYYEQKLEEGLEEEVNE